MKNIDIRITNPDDTALLCRLIHDSFRDVAERFSLTPEKCPKHPSNYTEEWVQKDFDRGVTYFILSQNNLPVGCVALEKANDDLFYLERLAVLPEMRRKGFGKSLVNHVFSKARAMGAKEISIGIIAAQAELNQWYQKIGFVEGETKEFPHLPFQVTFMTIKFK
jgi:N-acetylglutamate synthase-like GNAT family acetyltransferase